MELEFTDSQLYCCDVCVRLVRIQDMKDALASPTALFSRFQIHQSRFPTRQRQLTTRFQMNPQTVELLAERFPWGVYPRLFGVLPPVPYRSGIHAYYTTSL